MENTNPFQDDIFESPDARAMWFDKATGGQDVGCVIDREGFFQQAAQDLAIIEEIQDLFGADHEELCELNKQDPNRLALLASALVHLSDRSQHLHQISHHLAAKIRDVQPSPGSVATP